MCTCGGVDGGHVYLLHVTRIHLHAKGVVTFVLGTCPNCCILWSNSF